MSSPENYPQWTPEQRAEYDWLNAEVDRLKREVATCEQARQEELTRHRIATEAAQRIYDEYRADLDKLLARANQAEHNHQRANNRLVVLSRCLPEIVSFFLETYSCFQDAALTPDVREMRRNAREVLTLLEPFAS